MRSSRLQNAGRSSGKGREPSRADPAVAPVSRTRRPSAVRKVRPAEESRPPYAPATHRPMAERIRAGRSPDSSTVPAIPDENPATGEPMVELRPLLQLISLLSLLTGTATATAAGGDIPVFGKVLGPHDTAVAQVQLRLLPVPNSYQSINLALQGKIHGDSASEAHASSRGTFRLMAPHAGMWHVVASAKGFPPMTFALLPLDDEVDLPTLHMRPGKRLVIQVQDRSGKPIDGAFVRVSSSDPSATSPYSPSWFMATQIARSDPSGQVEFFVTRDKAVHVGVWASGFAPESLDAKSSNLRLQLAPTRTLALEAIDENGRPLPDVLALLDGVQPFGPTQQDGKLSVGVPEGAPFTLHALSPLGYETSLNVRNPLPPATGKDAGTPAVAPQEPRRIILKPPARLPGQVIASTTRDPVEGAIVWPAKDYTESARTDASGTFVLRRRDVGERWLYTAATGFFRHAQYLKDYQDVNSTRWPTVALEPKQKIAGRVLDEYGVPVPEVELSTRYNPADKRKLTATLRRSGGLSRSRPDGTFTLRELVPEAEYIVRLMKAGYATEEDRITAPAADETQTAPVTFILHREITARGTVLDTNEVPVVAAEIHLERSQDGDLRSRLANLLDPRFKLAFQTTTNADGEFAIGNLAAGAYDLSIESPGFAPRLIPTVEIIDTATGELDLGIFVLEPGATLEGRVLDSDGRPIPGAEIGILPDDPLLKSLPSRPPEPDAITDPEGHFRLPGLAPGSRIDLVVQAQGFLRVDRAGLTIPPQEELVIRMAPALTLTGSVLDTGGNPLHDAFVELDIPFTDPSGSTFRGYDLRRQVVDDDGQFEFVDLESGLIHVSADAPGHQRVHKSLRLDKNGIQPIQLILPQGAILQGSVTTPDGQPVLGAKIHVVAGSSGNAGSHLPEITETDGEGQYRLSGLPVGGATVLVSHDGYGQANKAISLGAGLNNLDFELGDGGRNVSGWVVTEGELLVAGARVSMSPLDQVLPWRDVITDASGRFEFSGVLRGRYRLRAEKEDAGRTDQPVLVTVGDAQLTDLRLVLQTPRTIRGRLVGLEADALSKVRFFLDGSMAFGDVGRDGSYRIEGVALGEHVVSAYVANRNQRAESPVTISPHDSEVYVDLFFERGFTLVGHVIWNGRPLASSTVMLRGIDAPIQTAQTDHQGTFRFEALPSGTYSIEVMHQPTGLQGGKTVVVDRDREVEVRLETGTVRGGIRDASQGLPISGAFLSLTKAGADDPDRARIPGYSSAAGKDGEFAFEHVPIGAWHLTVSKEGYVPLERTILVSRGESPPMEVVLVPRE
ncbi:MAG: hypothetical protein D6696_17240 [Acidobacteria bacterium]|nr:MAG: hypothetical protein D6696_17240 [Acidobacteriota bacterium]